MKLKEEISGLREEVQSLRSNSTSFRNDDLSDAPFPVFPIRDINDFENFEVNLLSDECLRKQLVSIT